jgi:hypothetical protein
VAVLAAVGSQRYSLANISLLRFIGLYIIHFADNLLYI